MVMSIHAMKAVEYIVYVVMHERFLCMTRGVVDAIGISYMALLIECKSLYHNYYNYILFNLRKIN